MAIRTGAPRDCYGRFVALIKDFFGTGGAERLRKQSNPQVICAFIDGRADLTTFFNGGGTVARAARILSDLALQSKEGARKVVWLLSDYAKLPKDVNTQSVEVLDRIGRELQRLSSSCTHPPEDVIQVPVDMYGYDLRGAFKIINQMTRAAIQAVFDRGNAIQQALEKGQTLEKEEGGTFCMMINIFYYLRKFTSVEK